jgi:hypothetical protein
MCLPGNLGGDEKKSMELKEYPHLFPNPLKCAIKQRTVGLYSVFFRIIKAWIKSKTVQVRLIPPDFLVEEPPGALQEELYYFPRFVHEMNILFMSSFFVEELEATFYAMRELKLENEAQEVKKAAETVGRIYAELLVRYHTLKSYLSHDEPTFARLRAKFKAKEEEVALTCTSKFIKAYSQICEMAKRFDVDRIFTYALNLPISIVLKEPELVERRFNLAMQKVLKLKSYLVLSAKDVEKEIPGFCIESQGCIYYHAPTCPIDYVTAPESPLKEYYELISCPRPRLHLPYFSLEHIDPIFSMYADPMGYQFKYHTDRNAARIPDPKKFITELIEPIITLEALRQQFIAGDGLHCPYQSCLRVDIRKSPEGCFVRQMLTALWEVTKVSVGGENITKWEKPPCIEGTPVYIQFPEEVMMKYHPYAVTQYLADALNNER